ncbi:hypothetical protein [Virgibacillus chiguensis]|uniref:Uncharacterized protein n=1 Tax=Virgibacillus chiguensis TaxID=411959 RepID=A0A1M5TWW7_9BACI|nr:hypothetical protein [Virgibacillus chiguensis]SHH55194.1 hypothetical protein SAMN05421807_108172 [Virgibacillus chiguensis]
MVRSVKGQFICWILISIAFIYVVSTYTEFTGNDVTNLLFYMVMISSIFNAGMATQKFLDNRKKDHSNH